MTEIAKLGPLCIEHPRRLRGAAGPHGRAGAADARRQVRGHGMGAVLLHCLGARLGAGGGIWGGGRGAGSARAHAASSAPARPPKGGKHHVTDAVRRRAFVAQMAASAGDGGGSHTDDPGRLPRPAPRIF